MNLQNYGDIMLVDWQIKERCEKNLISPYDPALINPSSIDIRLGCKILLDAPIGYKEIDISTTTESKPFWLPSNGFLLAATLEYFNVPEDLSIEIKLKSSLARQGLSHALAGHVDNGFCGSLTLELKNYSEFNDVKLYYGQRIAQAILWQTEKPTKSYQNTDYSYRFEPVQSR